MQERCGINPWRSTRERCFPHVPACLDCFAGPERSERKGLGHLCWSQRFSGQPWEGTEHHSLPRAQANDRRGEHSSLWGGLGCSRLACATLEGFLAKSRN